MRRSIIIGGVGAAVVAALAVPLLLHIPFDPAQMLASHQPSNAAQERAPASNSSTRSAEAGASGPQAPKPGWVTRCASTDRATPLDCSVEQRAVFTNTGQLVASVTVRVPDTHKPVMMIHLPLGLYLPAGVSLQVDGGAPLKFELQTCDNAGCYAGAPVSDEMLKSLRSSQTLMISFEGLNKQPIKVPMPMLGFSDAYEKIQ